MAATLAGLAAVQVIGDGTTSSTDGGVLTPQQAERQLAAATASPFGVERADAGPDEHAELRFEGTAGKVELRVRCVSGRPSGSWKQDD
ncbi:hypothetical protein [Streptomyces sp. NPDC097610]|uniref:hypothetical protein n=1 Tax=Streptomyces sp. NPDC097610 TaxID=3157227 RepID=UPI003326D2F7